MSKRKDRSPASRASIPSSGPSVRQAKSSKPTLSLEVELAEVEKLEKPEDIEAKGKKLRDDLVKEWNKGKEQRDIQYIETQMAVAKVLLTKLRYLPLTPTPENARDLVIARDILEIGVWFSIAKCERNTCNPDALKEFERYISQLKHYYFDMRKLLRDSEHMYEILGMNLLNLLSQYRIADFHRELELFIHRDVDAVLNNPYIKKAVEIEQYIMEGQYNKIYALKGAKADDLKRDGLTSAGFKYFIDHLENTLKEHTSEIADVIGTAYDKLSMQAAMQLLNLKESSKMADIIKKQKWVVREGYVYFHTKKDNNDIIPAEQLMKNALSYADELETIV